jgi:hypothetical protein
MQSSVNPSFILHSKYSTISPVLTISKDPDNGVASGDMSMNRAVTDHDLWTSQSLNELILVVWAWLLDSEMDVRLAKWE